MIATILVPGAMWNRGKGDEYRCEFVRHACYAAMTMKEEGLRGHFCWKRILTCVFTNV